ncbi:MAG TPA: universal stress protein [Candidatus Binatia bacterium]|jgi:nucleotide-binding universal stress UspA family protein
MKRFRRILHATDFSTASKRAFEIAVEFAKQNRAELLLVHVLVPHVIYPPDAEADPTFYLELERTTRRQAQSSLDALVGQVKRRKVKVKGLLLRGTAHDQIVRSAKNRRADMIVIGTHGRTGISKLLMGSVAGRVISEATCPVLTVRGK